LTWDVLTDGDVLLQKGVILTGDVLSMRRFDCGTFWQWDVLTGYLRVIFGVLENTLGLHLHAKFHLNVFIVSASSGQKLWANFDILGAPVPTAFHRWGPNLVCYSRPKVTCQISSRSVYSVELCWRKTSFLRFFALRNLVVSLTGSSLKKLDTAAQLQPSLSNGIKIVSVLQRLHGEIGRSISDVTDRQTDRETKNSTFLATPATGETRAPPNLAWW